MSYIISIDPGQRGCISLMTYYGSVQLVDYMIMPLLKTKKTTKKRVKGNTHTKDTVTTIKTTIDEDTVTEYLSKLRRDYQVDKVIIEKQFMRPSQGMGSSYCIIDHAGFLRGICMGLGLTVDIIPAQSWQMILVDGKEDTKTRSIATVKANMPDVNLLLKGKQKDHDGLADSINLGYFYLTNKYRIARE